VNPIERGLRRLDQAQQRHTPSAFVVGVVKKYGDDNGGTLASSLAHSAFVSVFPLLLIMITVLGLISSLDPALRSQVENAVINQFPLVSKQLREHPPALRRSSVIGLAIGMLGLTWGTTGLAQSGLFTMAQVWNLPGPARPGYLPRLGRCLLFLGVLGVGVVATTLLTGLGAFGRHIPVLVVLAEMVAGIVNIGLYFISFRVLTPKGVPSRALLPGVVTGGVAWTLMQALGGFLVHHFARTDSAYGVFGTVLGLVAWLYVVVQMTVYAAEVNVVLSRRLWPRSILQPPLTEAVRASMALQALQNQRRPEQQVRVTFNDRPAAEHGPTGAVAPRTPAQVHPPGEPVRPVAHPARPPVNPESTGTN
jgi:YihY family inner membrane protein